MRPTFGWHQHLRQDTRPTPQSQYEFDKDPLDSKKMACLYVLNIYKTHHETMQKRAEGTQQENTDIIISARKMTHKPFNYMT